MIDCGVSVIVGVLTYLLENACQWQPTPAWTGKKLRSYTLTRVNLFVANVYLFWNDVQSWKVFSNLKL